LDFQKLENGERDKCSFREAAPHSISTTKNYPHYLQATQPPIIAVFLFRLFSQMLIEMLQVISFTLTLSIRVQKPLVIVCKTKDKRAKTCNDRTHSQRIARTRR
jgi:hypothetical protein